MTVDRSAGRPLRIATVGFQGFGNVGDEAILTGIEALLEESGAEVRVVFSGPRPDSISAFSAARRIVTRRHLPTLAAWRVLRDVDLLLLAGGGLLNDHWPWVVPRYVAWTLAARTAGARVAWVGVGVGPIRRKLLRWLARLGAMAASPVLVRDEESRALLGRAGRPQVIPDPSLFNQRPTSSPGVEVAVVVRAPVRRRAESERQLVASIVGLVARLEERGSAVVVLTMGGGDDEMLLAALREAFIDRQRPVPRTEALGPTPAAALARLAACDAIVTVRLHGLLLGILAGVPVVPISYDAKVRLAAERLGISELTVPLHSVDPGTVLERLDASRAADLRATVEDKLHEMRAEGPAIARAILGTRSAS